jgi:3D (Asp-Asp-Asp) domain-containing protein
MRSLIPSHAVLEPRRALAHAAAILGVAWHSSILSWQSTWVVVAALLMAPVPGLRPQPARLPAVEIPIAPALLLPAFPLTAIPPVLPPPIPVRKAVDAAIDGIPVTITAYASEVQHTDDEPFITATGRVVRPGILAVSRDLLRTYTPGAPFDYGDRVRLARHGEFVIEDTMNPRWRNRVDVWVPTVLEAREFGLRRGRLYALAPRPAAPTD